MRPRVGDEVFEHSLTPYSAVSTPATPTASRSKGAPALCGRLRRGRCATPSAQVTAGQAAAPGGPVFNGVEGGNRHHRHPRGAVGLAGPSRADRGRHRERRCRVGRVTTMPGSCRSSCLQYLHGSPPDWSPPSHPAATALADLVYGDAVLVTYVVDKAGIEHDLADSGFLVPRSEGLLMTACSWRRRNGGTTTTDAMRSCGPAGAPTIVAGSTSTRATTRPPRRRAPALTVGLHAEPVTRITPWRQSLPQYRPGHGPVRRDRHRACARRRGLVVAGAQMRGLGLPACVRQAAAVAGTSAVSSLGRSGRERAPSPDIDHRTWSTFLRAGRRSRRCAGSAQRRRRRCAAGSAVDDDLVVPRTHRASRRACRKQAVVPR